MGYSISQGDVYFDWSTLSFKSRSGVSVIQPADVVPAPVVAGSIGVLKGWLGSLMDWGKFGRALALYVIGYTIYREGRNAAFQLANWIQGGGSSGNTSSDITFFNKIVGFFKTAGYSADEAYSMALQFMDEGRDGSFGDLADFAVSYGSEVVSSKDDSAEYFDRLREQNVLDESGVIEPVGVQPLEDVVSDEWWLKKGFRSIDEYLDYMEGLRVVDDEFEEGEVEDEGLSFDEVMSLYLTEDTEGLEMPQELWEEDLMVTPQVERDNRRGTASSMYDGKSVSQENGMEVRDMGYGYGGNSRYWYSKYYKPGYRKSRYGNYYIKRKTSYGYNRRY